jgi:hypothetical protein
MGTKTMTTAILEQPIARNLSDVEQRPSATTTTLSRDSLLSTYLKPIRFFRYPFHGGEFTISMERTPPSWFFPTIESLGGLLSLERGWDSYGSPRIDPKYVSAALDLIFITMQDNTPPPSIVPTSRGGLQLEWHIRGIDLEIEFISPYRIHLFWDNPGAGRFVDAEVSQDLGPLFEALSSITLTDEETYDEDASDGEG